MLPKLRIVGNNSTSFTVKTDSGNTVHIDNTFAEMFPLWASRVLVTAQEEKWAQIAAIESTGMASSIIESAEAAIERSVPADQTPDKRLGVLFQIYTKDRFHLKHELVERIGQCVLTCPTTAAYNGLDKSKRVLTVGRSLRYFGDGFERKTIVADRKCWKIPVMDGNFIVEDGVGAMEAVGGGNFMIFAENQSAGLKAAVAATEAIRTQVADVIMPFPSSICRSGSKDGSMKYKLKASTNHRYCPTLRTLVPDSVVPENVTCVYEIVLNGLSLDAVKKALKVGVHTAADIKGVVKISSGNYGGKIGPLKAFLKDAIESV